MPSFVSSGRHSANAHNPPPTLRSDCSSLARQMVTQCYNEVATNDPYNTKATIWTTSSLVTTDEGHREVENAFARWSAAPGFNAKNGYKLHWRIAISGSRVDVFATLIPR